MINSGLFRQEFEHAWINYFRLDLFNKVMVVCLATSSGERHTIRFLGTQRHEDQLLTSAFNRRKGFLISQIGPQHFVFSALPNEHFRGGPLIHFESFIDITPTAGAAG